MLIIEWRVDLPMDGVYYANQASEILKELFRQISDSAQDGLQYMAMLDEVTFNKNGFNFLQLFRGIQIEKVIGLITVNPAAYECTKEINMQPPEDRNVKAYQLKTMHRNGFHIANMLVHYNIFRLKERASSNYKVISSLNDVKLDITKMAKSHMPIWIKQRQSATDLEVFEFISQDLLKTDKSSVTFLHSPYKPLSVEIKDFCHKQNWSIATLFDFTGSEDDTIISLIEDSVGALETFSRAKNRLIIITRYDSNKLICILNEKFRFL